MKLKLKMFMKIFKKIKNYLTSASIQKIQNITIRKKLSDLKWMLWGFRNTKEHHSLERNACSKLTRRTLD